jgi:hypothetical protein
LGALPDRKCLRILFKLGLELAEVCGLNLQFDRFSTERVFEKIFTGM